MKTCKGRNDRDNLLGTFVGLALSIGVAGCDLYYGKDVPSDNPPGTDPSCTEEPNIGDGIGDGGSFPLELGPTVQADEAPPAISGGTLAITPDGNTVVAADPDRDQVYLVSLQTQSLVATIALNKNDEPGRVVIDSAQRAYVALRKHKQIAVIDINQGVLIDRYEACPAPRGLAIDELTNSLYAACHNGELVTLDLATGQITAERRLESGLRDVVVDSDHIYVTKFRTAEAFVLDRAGQVLETLKPPVLSTFTTDFETGAQEEVQFEPSVAWRTIRGANGGIVMVHQRGRKGKVSVGRGGYGGQPCGGGVVHAAITPMRRGQTPIATAAMDFSVLPVDLALLNGGQEGVLVSAGNNSNGFVFLPPVMRVPVGVEHRPFECFFGTEYEAWQGQPIAAASTTVNNTVAVQFREPAALSIFANDVMSSPVFVPLSATSRNDTGHLMFHMNTGAGIACASCHPEGGDDARTWEFNCIGPRRTQSLHIGLLGTEPFHWDGDMDTLDTLMTEVFVGRMSGGQPNSEQITAMAAWLNTLQAPLRPEPADTTAVERGRQIFENPTVGCVSCHSGAKFTNNLSYNVGTGGVFQVPSLVGIANRAPFIHTGCAPTLRDRFTNPACGGGDSHGAISGLSSQQIDDLITYLETL